MPSTVFDLISWLTTSPNTNALPTGDLYEHRVGYQSAQVLLDRTPPIGHVIINENIVSGGIRLHEFGIYKENDTAITPTNFVIQDRLGSNLVAISSTNFGGSTDESIYVPVGYRNNYSVVAFLAGSDSIDHIIVGATASRAKEYIVEIQKTSSAVWIPILSMIASENTREFIKYSFSTAVSGIGAVRLRYAGDFYSSSNTGNSIIISSYDALCNVDSMQVSRYSDFSDSTEFPGADINGWVTVEEGTHSYSWDLINNTKRWVVQNVTDGITLQEINHLYKVGNNLIAIGLTKSYVLPYSSGSYGSIRLGYTFNSNITSAIVATHNNKIYVGLADGTIYSSYDGENYSIESIAIPAVPITALVSYQNSLYIGIDQSGGTDIGAVYAWDGTDIVMTHYIAAPTVSCFGVAKSSLYVGTRGTGTGYVYKYNGHSDWRLSFNTESNDVQILVYSPINEKLWCGVEEGRIFAAAFDASNNPTWSSLPFFEGESSDFYSITTDLTKDLPATVNDVPVNNFVWIASNTEITTYINTSAKISSTAYSTDERFEVIQYPSVDPVTNIKDFAYFNDDLFGAGSDGSIYKFDLSVMASNNRYVYVRLKDEAGNMSDLPSSTSIEYIYDRINQDTDRASTGTRISDGKIYQVKYSTDTIEDKKLLATITSNSQGEILSPNRRVEISGYYISPPFYVANLTRWDKISFLYNFPDCPVQGDDGLDRGVSIDLYVKTADSRQELTDASWGTTPYSVSNINLTTSCTTNVAANKIVSSDHGLVDATEIRFLYNRNGLSTSAIYKVTNSTTGDFQLLDSNDTLVVLTGDNLTNVFKLEIEPSVTLGLFEAQINALLGRWIQFYVVLNTANKNITPQILNVSLFYKASGASYFFTSMINAAQQFGKYYNHIVNSDFEMGTWPWKVETGATLLTLTTTLENETRMGVIHKSSGSPGVNDYITTEGKFSVDVSFANKQFVISFDYQTSADYVDGDIQVQVINNDTPKTTTFDLLKKEDIFHFTGAVNLEENGGSELSYLIIFKANTGTSAYDLLIDNIYFGPSYVLSNSSPKFYRGLLTANTSITSGSVTFAYTTVEGIQGFQFNENYIQILPNRMFELDTPSTVIRFAILFTKLGDDPVIVHDFAVQLEAHDIDMKLMALPEI